MATYKQLMELMRAGKSPEEIMKRLNLAPSQWRRLLKSKRLREEMEIAESLAVVMAVHQVAASVQSAADRFGELMDSDNPETARKVAMALLREGLQASRRRDRAAGEPDLED